MNILNIISFVKKKEGEINPLSSFVNIVRVDTYHGRLMQCYIAIRSPFIVKANILNHGTFELEEKDCNNVYLMGYYKTRLHGSGWKYYKQPVQSVQKVQKV